MCRQTAVDGHKHHAFMVQSEPDYIVPENVNDVKQFIAVPQDSVIQAGYGLERQPIGYVDRVCAGFSKAGIKADIEA